MASPPPAKPPRTELDNRLSYKRIDAVIVICREVIKWGAIVLLGRYSYLSIVALAGHDTFADVAIRFLSNIRVSEGVLYLLAGGSIAYGVGQRQLRRRHIKRNVGSKNELERAIHTGRTSSDLTETGTTRPGDEL